MRNTAMQTNSHANIFELQALDSHGSGTQTAPALTQGGWGIVSTMKDQKRFSCFYRGSEASIQFPIMSVDMDCGDSYAWTALLMKDDVTLSSILTFFECCNPHHLLITAWSSSELTGSSSISPLASFLANVFSRITVLPSLNRK